MDRNYTQYLDQRSDYFKFDDESSVGSDISLSANEKIVNKHLMKLKNAEIEKGIQDPASFIPWNHFFNVLDRINSSELYKIIQKMPKGGILHAHDTALCSTDYVISLTYKENLWQCKNTKTKSLEFKFSREAPASVDNKKWTRVADVRAEMGEEIYNSQLRSHFSLYNTDPINHNRDMNSIWNQFMDIFGASDGLLMYAPVWREYYKRFLTEMMNDGVQYLELRGTLPTVNSEFQESVRFPLLSGETGVKMHFKVVFLLLAICAVVGHGVNIVDRLGAKMQALRQAREYSNYMDARSDYLDYEEDHSVGSDINLSPKEQIVNKHLMQLKTTEIKNGLQDPASFIPWNHVFNVLDRINSSEIFKIIQKMPKGGILHAHDTALCSTDYVISLTYKENLWQCTDSTGALQFKFARVTPASSDACATWTRVADERKTQGEEKYNSILRSQLSMYTTDPINHNRDVDSIWRQFMGIFGVNSGLLMYAPVWREYYKRFLTEMMNDGVQYLELRGTLPPLYDLDGKVYNEEENLQIYFEVTQEFKKENPTFIGAKFIYAPVRVVTDPDLPALMKKVVDLHNKFPTFLAGFDLVGQEDKGRPLLAFSKNLLTLPDDINFFFHAGETNWFGETDDNLIDAVLLGTKRIGHGYAVLKHPRVLKQIRRDKIAIEVCPVSNQVLRLVADMRNHPGSVLLANKEYPVVISSDDPSFWEATPLSHDFYMAFLGLASSRQDLRLLKQLAMNSITYSSMTTIEKSRAVNLWTTQWNKFIDDMAASLI
ncbi:Adenosine deaminase [Sergentomyia squamirostris]